LHRNHFKGDWHRYNLKRKVANLPCVTADEFQTRKASHEPKVDDKKRSQNLTASRAGKSSQMKNHMRII